MRRHFLFDICQSFARWPAVVRWAVVPLGVAASLMPPLLRLAAVVATGIGYDHFEGWLATPDAPLPFNLWAALLFGLLTLANAMVGNWAFKQYETWESERLPKVRDFFRNHDLSKLVGQSLGMVLREAEADGAAMPSADRAILLRLARCAEREWVGRIEQYPLLADAWLGSLQDRQLVAFIRDPRQLALDDGQAGKLLVFLDPTGQGHAPAFTDPATEPAVRGLLRRRFSVALREALKRDFARRGAAAYGMLLDIAGELLNAGAARVARTEENDAAIRAAAESLTECANRLDRLDRDLRRRCESLAQGLLATHRAVREEGQASAQRDAETHERLARIEAQLREALTSKQLGEDPTQRQLPPELLEKAKLLLQRGTKEQQAVAEIALKHHDQADRLIQDLKKEPLAEAFRLLSLEGDNWYNAGEFDKAIPPYEQAWALQPDNPDGA